MDGTHLTGNMIVGDDVFISINVSTVNDNAMGQAGYEAHIVGPRIADGAGAVVTKDVAPHTKVMGIPARPT